MQKKKIIVILFLLLLMGCASPKHVLPHYHKEDKSVNLYAFVGKKISVIQINPNDEEKDIITIDSVTGEKIIHRTVSMDSGFRCKYLVLKNVFNELVTDTVDFVAYDHYGRPRFEQSEYVLLYISKSTKENYFFHQKYQYDHLERNSEGQFYGYDYTIKERKRYTIYKDKRQASPEELFIKRKEAVFKPFFNYVLIR